MRYLMKQRLFTLADKYNVTDADGKDVYYVEGKLLSFGKNLSFQDMEQKELAHIQQKLLKLGTDVRDHARWRSRGGREEGVVHLLPLRIPRG